MRRRGAGHHIARILLVPWRVGHDELAQGGGKVSISNVYRDALFALGFQPVGKQGQVYLISRGASVLGARNSGQLIGENAFAVVQQAAYQGGLSVIHGTRRNQSQYPELVT